VRSCKLRCCKNRPPTANDRLYGLYSSSSYGNLKPILEGHSSITSFFKRDVSYTCAPANIVLTDKRVERSLCNSRASCLSPTLAVGDAYRSSYQMRLWFSGCVCPRSKRKTDRTVSTKAVVRKWGQTAKDQGQSHGCEKRHHRTVLVKCAAAAAGVRGTCIMAERL